MTVLVAATSQDGGGDCDCGNRVGRVKGLRHGLYKSCENGAMKLKSSACSCGCSDGACGSKILRW